MSSTVVTAKFEDGGVVIDPTSVVLSDSTGTYGVKRNDTDATVIADGTSMIQSGTGEYYYAFTDPASDLTYTYSIEYVYDGVTLYITGTISGGSGSTEIGSLTLSEIRSDIRNILRDFNGITWTDSMITDGVNTGQQEFAIRTQSLKKSSSITITADTATYSLPSDCLMIYRVDWDDQVLPIVVTEYMDQVYGSEWRTATGADITHVIQDAQGSGEIRIYPYIDDSDNIDSTLDIDYAYLPADLSSDSDTSDLPARYHRALVHYAIYYILQHNVQSEQSLGWSRIHKSRFEFYLRDCRRTVSRGYAVRKNARVTPRSW